MDYILGSVIRLFFPPFSVRLESFHWTFFIEVLCLELAWLFQVADFIYIFYFSPYFSLSYIYIYIYIYIT